MAAAGGASLSGIGRPQRRPSVCAAPFRVARSTGNGVGQLQVRLLSAWGSGTGLSRRSPFEQDDVAPPAVHATNALA
ncbi:MAG TPA: hypothetical protein VJ375_10670, partial [Gaiellaceae bacterium]|nr:hypothetical protein [Gaiellaceae bacterium]